MAEDNVDLKLLGQDQLLPWLQHDISQVTQSIMVVGPWLDAYFVAKVLDSMQTTKIGVCFLVRIDGDELIDAKTLSALNLARENLENFQARTLPYLHSKVILLDQALFYLGSANWYWYSLHKSLETTITGKIDILPGLTTEMDRYWEKATPLTREDLRCYHDLEPHQRDPYRYRLK
ncbi:phospholipase D-like domain-containing protein [Methanobacterium formicicum]|uniref:PLD phosphodiesterase domain-containing protein n=1 Tax=Methanobacterium formicicum TaxID=2162 RepID=A0A090I4L6_METFO|nr:phospholipase D-like domain-containing protein [Methanobacterium formicicum]MDH2660424.1 hypothetical protein [Methanobacterium formicicum]CEA14199.1 hypothetical protein DSM1535_1874 [Methanobacterium formicicum]